MFSSATKFLTASIGIEAEGIINDLYTPCTPLETFGIVIYPHEMFNHQMPLDWNSEPAWKLGLLQFVRVCLISPGEACGVRGQMGPSMGLPNLQSTLCESRFISPTLFV